MGERKKENRLIAWYKNFNNKHKRLCEIIRFVIVGGFATVIDMFTMGVVLYAFNPSLYPNFFNVFFGGGDPSTIATVVGTGLGFVVSLIANYLLSVLFVYEDKGNSKSFKGIVLFVTLSVIGLLINMGGMWLGYDICHINEWITKIIMTLLVLVYNYITRKLFIFKKQPIEQPSNAESVESADSEKEAENLVVESKTEESIVANENLTKTNKDKAKSQKVTEN